MRVRNDGDRRHGLIGTHLPFVMFAVFSVTMARNQIAHLRNIPRHNFMNKLLTYPEVKVVFGGKSTTSIRRYVGGWPSLQCLHHSNSGCPTLCAFQRVGTSNPCAVGCGPAFGLFLSQSGKRVRNLDANVRGSRPSQTARRTGHQPVLLVPARSTAWATRS